MSAKASMLDIFVAPRPNRPLIRLMGSVNRVAMLRGVPVLRDVPPFRWIAGLRGVANIRHIDFPAADRERLAGIVGAGQATFLAPNHPEFFTDWMIDKELISGFAPLCASWATNGIVNGLGRLVQRFWLANNLIAQIPGNNAAARAHSVDWALKGHGVLLHPEGAVGWHCDWIAPLMPGAAEMAMEALRRGRDSDPGFKAWVAPIVWKLVFMRDVEAELLAECAYVERKLDIDPGSHDLTPAQRVFRIYEVLLARDAEKAGIAVQSAAPFATRHAAVVEACSNRLETLLPTGEDGDLVRRGRRFLRDQGRGLEPQAAQAIRSGLDTLQRLRRLGPYAWQSAVMTQEQVAEHIKRIRNDYCKGTLRDTLNALVPQPVGPRVAHVRTPEPIAIHAFQGTDDDATDELRRRMQAVLDALNAELEADGVFKSYPNPFYGQ
jgi:hypothetical protein